MKVVSFIIWKDVSKEQPPERKLLITRREGESGTNLCSVAIHPDGTLEWIESVSRRTTITHDTFLHPTHWFNPMEIPPPIGIDKGDLWWDSEDPENGVYDYQELVDKYGPGEIVQLQRSLNLDDVWAIRLFDDDVIRIFGTLEECEEVVKEYEQKKMIEDFDQEAEEAKQQTEGQDNAT
jgi:hypothetical protein